MRYNVMVTLHGGMEYDAMEYNVMVTLYGVIGYDTMVLHDTETIIKS
jgi:hypothetical protein